MRHFVTYAFPMNECEAERSAPRFLGVPLRKPKASDYLLSLLIAVGGALLVLLFSQDRSVAQFCISFLCFFSGSLLSSFGFSFARYPVQTSIMISVIVILPMVLARALF